MSPDELRALLPLLPPGTDVWLIHLRIPGPPPATSANPAEPLPDDEVQQPDDHPEERLKVGPTARRSGIPVRELRRAIKRELIRYRVKEGGRDDGAHLIDDADLEAYRAKREEIRLGHQPKPENWPGPVEVPYSE